MLHEEADGIAVGPTAKAVIELLGWADRETGRFFPVERAQPQQVGAAFAQRHMTADDIDDVGPCNDFLDEGLWDLAAWSKTGHRLLREMAADTDVPDQFIVAVAMVRHLLVDPVLPAGLLPADWPADRLRTVYAEFADLLASRRDDELLEA